MTVHESKASEAPEPRNRSRLAGKLLRSLLFSPGQRQHMIDKALATDADAVILDLEDGVPPAEKDAARERVALSITNRREPGTPLRLVRVNPRATGRLDDDLERVVCTGLDAVLLPKVEARQEVVWLDQALSDLEARKGLEPESVAIVAAIESAWGIHNAVDIVSASRRLEAAMFGAEDLALDLGLPVRRRGAGQEMLHARSALVLAAAIGRIQPLDQVWLDFRDLDGLRAEAIAGRDMGFAGKCLIHPRQIAVVNEVFRPSLEDVELAHRVVGAFDEARANGVGAVMLGGQLVELPIVERARRTIEADYLMTIRRGEGQATE